MEVRAPGLDEGRGGGGYRFVNLEEVAERLLIPRTTQWCDLNERSHAEWFPQVALLGPATQALSPARNPQILTFRRSIHFLQHISVRNNTAFVLFP